MLMAGAPEPMNYKTSTIGSKFTRNDSRGASDWVFLDRLREMWSGKLVVKGINNVDDAVKVKKAGCDAVYVSNHGGRQLDSGQPAIETLPHIRNAVGADFPIIFDSGIRTADDIVRALASGADFIMIGRPMLFALGADGPTGLSVFLDRLEDDLRSVMAQIGITNIQAIDSKCLVTDQEQFDG